MSLRSRGPANGPNRDNDGYDPSKPIPRMKGNPTVQFQVNKDARKSRVGDKIKKRMSMRYADISDPSLLSGRAGAVDRIPAMPILREDEPGGRVFVAEPRGRNDLRPLQDDVQYEEDVRQDPKTIDLSILEQQNFDPDAYLKIKLANSTEAELNSLRSSLEASKAATAADLQRNVFKNYAEFVLISKEISTLENDMLELKESLSEWRSMPSLLTIEAETASTSVADRRRTNRSSVADLRTLYASQLQELHLQIEGSSKFAPAIPGRHIVSEFSDLWSLNSATYKVEYAVHMVLLDDLLLVAKKRKRRTGEGGKLVAQRCWPLNDIVLVDVKDSIDLTNVIKIRRSKETHVFRTDLLTDKKALLGTFRQIAEELATKKRKEREGEHERRRSVWTGDRNSIAVTSAPIPALPPWLADLQLKGLGVGSSMKEKEDNDIRMLNEYADKLAVAIALRDWDEAVKLIEQGNPVAPSAGSGSNTSSALPPKIEALKHTLISDLLHALSDPTHRKLAVIKHTSYLSRLKVGPAARDAFLSTRSELIRKRIRAIRFEGNISLYISELALVTFMMIKHTSDWFLTSFKEHDMASGMVQWAKDQIEIFAKMFQRQVYGLDSDAQTIQECIQVTKLQSKRLLQDHGLDFGFLLDQLLVPPSSTSTSKPAAAASQPTPTSALAPTSSLSKAPSASSLANRSGRQARTPITSSPRPYSPAPPGPPPQRSRDRPSSLIGHTPPP